MRCSAGSTAQEGAICLGSSHFFLKRFTAHYRRRWNMLGGGRRAECPVSTLNALAAVVWKSWDGRWPGWSRTPSSLPETGTGQGTSVYCAAIQDDGEGDAADSSHQALGNSMRLKTQIRRGISTPRHLGAGQAEGTGLHTSDHQALSHDIQRGRVGPVMTHKTTSCSSTQRCVCVTKCPGRGLQSWRCQPTHPAALTLKRHCE